MKYVYAAANLPDAHLVKNLLEHAGIPAHVFNANAQSALGELPMQAAYPQVWITQLHQEEQARALIADYQQRATESASKICAQCGESNPHEFDYCWHCSQPLDPA